MAANRQHKRVFLRGLAAILPTVLTLAIIIWVFSLIQTYFGQYINKAAAFFYLKYYVWSHGITDEQGIATALRNIESYWGKYLFWVGFVLAVIGVYVFGKFLASFFGRFIWRAIEGTLIQLPIIRQIYPSVKQVTDFLLAERKLEYSKVVAVEYPRKGIWSIGLVTNPGMKSLDEKVAGDLLTIFIPSSPTPVTGYTITVRREEVIDLPISIDDALRFTISGGVIQPMLERMGQVQLGFSDVQQVLAGTSDKEKAE